MYVKKLPRYIQEILAKCQLNISKTQQSQGGSLFHLKYIEEKFSQKHDILY